MKAKFFALTAIAVVVLLSEHSIFAAYAKKTEIVDLQTFDQKVSYFQGYNVVKNFQKNNVVLDEKVFIQAVHDALANTSPQLPESEWPALREQLGKVVKEAQESERKKIIETNSKLEEKFLADNRKKKDVIVTNTGLQYKIITVGNGPKPSVEDIVKLNYIGKLLDGTIFDSSDSKPVHPVSLQVARLIPGWKEALQLMPVGSKWEIYIPSYLGYGASVGNAKVPPASTLIFEVELLETHPFIEMAKPTQETKALSVQEAKSVEKKQ